MNVYHGKERSVGSIVYLVATLSIQIRWFCLPSTERGEHFTQYDLATCVPLDIIFPTFFALFSIVDYLTPN